MIIMSVLRKFIHKFTYSKSKSITRILCHMFLSKYKMLYMMIQEKLIIILYNLCVCVCVKNKSYIHRSNSQNSQFTKV